VAEAAIPLSLCRDADLVIKRDGAKIRESIEWKWKNRNGFAQLALIRGYIPDLRLSALIFSKAN
jgi:hypothetical protein